jgi:phosphoglycerate dehydrogenase-like enzyme
MRRALDGGLPDGVHRLIRREELPDALPQVHALVLACPLTRETRCLIGKDELEALPRSAILVNIARGEIIDEQALIDVLERKAIRGATLDVFEREPLPADNPLWQLPNVLISPHSASTVPDENARIVDIFVENLRRFLGDKPLKNEFVPERGY